MTSLLLARNFALLWAFVACLGNYPYIGAAFIFIVGLSHWLLIRAVLSRIDE